VRNEGVADPLRLGSCRTHRSGQFRGGGPVWPADTRKHRLNEACTRPGGLLDVFERWSWSKTLKRAGPHRGLRFLPTPRGAQAVPQAREHGSVRREVHAGGHLLPAAGKTVLLFINSSLVLPEKILCVCVCEWVSEWVRERERESAGCPLAWGCDLEEVKPRDKMPWFPFQSNHLSTFHTSCLCFKLHAPDMFAYAWFVCVTHRWGACEDEGLLRKGLYSHRAVGRGSRQFPWKQLQHRALGLLLCVWRLYFYWPLALVGLMVHCNLCC